MLLPFARALRPTPSCASLATRRHAATAALLAACAACSGDAARSAADARAAARDSSAGEVASAAARGAPGAPAAGGPASRPACAPDNGGLTLPTGFCATVFADSVGGARHVSVAPNGDVFVALSVPKRSTSERGSSQAGGVLALRDADGDGRADSTALFGARGGTGIAVARGWLYVDQGPEVVRYPMPAGSLRPGGAPQTVVSGLPTGGHEAHNLVLDGRGALFVNVGSLTNSCQQDDRTTGSPGVDPCTELQTRAGVWRFAADRAGQRFSPAARYATGIRNAMGLAVEPASGRLYTTQHGRDQLYQNWGTRFTAAESAELPAEEFMQVDQGDDFGWPYCYYDQQTAKRLVLAPEYGGDGTAVGRCAAKKAPVAVFPGHWAPMSSLFYTGRAFPARYRDGVFIAFHGSWNRAPLPQAGYRVVFQPMRGGAAGGRFETFADGFAGGRPSPATARHRPVGLAQAPDGGVYVTDDARGRIWKIVYTGAR